MRQRLNPWVVVITTALTFGSLMTFLGPRFHGHYGWGPRSYYGHHYGYQHGHCDGYQSQPEPAQPAPKAN